MKAPILFALATAYGTALGALYLFAYWGTFNVNFLEYVSIPDVLRLSLYPLLASSAFFLLGFVQSQIVVHGKIEQGGGRHAPVGRFAFKYWRVIVFLLISGAVLLSTLVDSPYIWITIAFMLACACVPMVHHEATFSILPNPSVRFFVIFFLPLFAGQAFAFGKIKANDVKIAYKTMIIDTKRTKLDIETDVGKPAVFLGRLGDKFVVYETATTRLVFISTEHQSPIYTYTPNSEP